MAYTADSWTTANMKHSFLGITAHWIDQGWTFRALVIGFELLKGSHTGDNLAATMVKVLQELGLEKKPFFLTTDNASNMYTMATKLEEKLSSDVFSATNNHIPCIGHVINLVVQEAINRGLKAEAPEADQLNEVDEGETCKLNILYLLHFITHVYIFLITYIIYKIYSIC